MATGKKAKDIFTRTVRTPEIGLEAAPRIKGRPPASEPYDKVTIILFKRQVIQLDKVALAIREKTGQHVRRTELVRALVEQAAASLNPDAEDFDKTVRALLPNLEEG